MLYQHHRLIRRISALGAFIWMVVIFIESSQPSGPTVTGLPGEDKVIHAIAYGLLACLLLFAQTPSPQGFQRRHSLTAAIVATLYGLSDEWHQSFVPTRSADGWDLLADGIGALLAAGIAGWLSRKYYSSS